MGGKQHICGREIELLIFVFAIDYLLIIIAVRKNPFATMQKRT